MNNWSGVSAKEAFVREEQSLVSGIKRCSSLHFITIHHFLINSLSSRAHLAVAKYVNVLQ